RSSVRRAQSLSSLRRNCVWRAMASSLHMGASVRAGIKLAAGSYEGRPRPAWPVRSRSASVAASPLPGGTMTRGPMFTDRDVFESMLREISAADGTHYQDLDTIY